MSHPPVTAGRRAFLRRIVILGTFVFLASGCATTPPASPSVDPRVALRGIISPPPGTAVEPSRLPPIRASSAPRPETACEPRAEAPFEPTVETAPESLREGEDAEVWARLTTEFGAPGTVPAPVTRTRCRTDGDWYRVELERFFADRWVLPAVLGGDELRSLSCRVKIKVDAEFRVTSFEIVRSSGNPVLDASVRGVLEELTTSGTPLPPIPEAIRDYAVANGFLMTWRGMAR